MFSLKYESVVRDNRGEKGGQIVVETSKALVAGPADRWEHDAEMMGRIAKVNTSRATRFVLVQNIPCRLHVRDQTELDINVRDRIQIGISADQDVYSMEISRTVASMLEQLDIDRSGTDSKALGNICNAIDIGKCFNPGTCRLGWRENISE